MRIFVTGASGYIGGSIATTLAASGHEVVGLVRSAAKAEHLRRQGIEPALGELADVELLKRCARESDAVINAASSDDRVAVEAFIEALADSGKPLLHTSGSSVVVADSADGEKSERILDEDTPFEPLPERRARWELDRRVIQASSAGIRSAVLCNTLIYGKGRGANPNSIQIPRLMATAREKGVAVYIGKGENIWSNVHIDDLVDLYRLALERAPAGSYFYVENGEASFKDIAEAISRALGFGGRAESWSPEQAIREWGERWRLSFGSNSRVRGKRAREALGWKPRHQSLLEAIATGRAT
jgi:nucleoside-diphosphate-sugar epimerase